MKKIKQAQNILQKIKEEDTKLVKAKKCICCRRKLEVLNPGNFNLDPLEQENLMLKNGTICSLDPAYGSIHDNDSFYIAICDDCLTAGLEKGTVEDVAEIRKKEQFHNNFKGFL